MLDLPSLLCCITLETGAKIHQSRDCTRIIEPNGVSYTLESIGGLDGMPKEMRPSLEHFHSSYQQSLQLERVLSVAEGDCDQAQYFPIIVSRRPASCKSPLDNAQFSHNRYSIRFYFVVYYSTVNQQRNIVGPICIPVP